MISEFQLGRASVCAWTKIQAPINDIFHQYVSDVLDHGNTNNKFFFFKFHNVILKGRPVGDEEPGWSSCHPLTLPNPTRHLILILIPPTVLKGSMDTHLLVNLLPHFLVNHILDHATPPLLTHR
jgi:hypothetical protein